ncbi:DNA repair protein RadA [Borrelia hermsii]|uniref:DNA repair protein RadA n=3 Tax=Borrelia hermsii TaxID=140 RepID=A0AAN1CEZ4_BORHE|nr:DNA repair protein RadA [Borrelia hermsii]AAX16934.1 DNA repair protein RadA [Borrelia hermsii DAH]AJW73227.1 DNA repair protein RadA [Borrelia hermsii CC1]AMR75418.1 DNA repair protein RadA [Borrelia hermsii]ANA43232.1 DNA repair protein RadA [Borrelia hermsii HS1]UCP01439.1 DNA repair protein RadA [Borrelia hermsii]
MAKKKDKEIYKCLNCGYKSLKWLGKCPECFSWESLEHYVEPKSSYGANLSKSKSEIFSLKDFKQVDNVRYLTGIEEFDRVLGAGIVIGSAILISGEPGIGKSTFLLQISSILSLDGKNVLYLAGEESIPQIKLRANRLKISSDILITNEIDVDALIEMLANIELDFMVVDSIQTLNSREVQGSLGGVAQLKHCVYKLVEWAKGKNITLCLVGHVTKDGILAGPKIIEHMVDSVFYFEEAKKSLRMLRATKNRFGTINEIGIFEMTSLGLVEIKDPSSIFLERKEEISSGIAIGIINEGSRVLFVEIQALITRTGMNISRIFSEKIDSKKISRILAVISKYLNLNFNNDDIYVNVSGGLRIDDVEIELAVLVALFSAKTNVIISQELIFTGEISLSGEIKVSSNIESKVIAALKAGFKSVFGANLRDNHYNGYESIGSVLGVVRRLVQDSRIKDHENNLFKNSNIKK